MDTDDELEEKQTQILCTGANLVQLADAEQEPIGELLDHLAEKQMEISGNWQVNCETQLPIMQAEQQIRAENYVANKENVKINILQQDRAADMFDNKSEEVMEQFYPTEHTELKRCHRKDWLSQQTRGQTDENGMKQTYMSSMVQIMLDKEAKRGREQEDEYETDTEYEPAWNEYVWNVADEFQSENKGTSVLQEGEVINIAQAVEENRSKDWTFSIVKGESENIENKEGDRTEVKIPLEKQKKEIHEVISKQVNKMLTNWTEPLDFTKPTYPYASKEQGETAYLDKLSQDYRNPKYFKRPFGKIDVEKGVYYVAIDRIQKAAEQNGWQPTEKWLGRLVAQMVTVEAEREKEKSAKRPMSEKAKRMQEKAMRQCMAEPRQVRVDLAEEMRADKPAKGTPLSLIKRTTLYTNRDLTPPQGFWDRWRDNAYQDEFQKIIEEMKPKSGELVIAHKHMERIGVPEAKVNFGVT